MVAELVETIPLVLDAEGVYRIGGTRVTLDLVVECFEAGASAEEIVEDFQTLELYDVYQVIGYYLRHKPDFLPYLAARKQLEQQVIAELADRQPVGLRARLEVVRAIRVGIEADQDGRVRPAREALQELGDKLGLPR
jgi:uncharacterized protein (DUF433 family)